MYNVYLRLLFVVTNAIIYTGSTDRVSKFSGGRRSSEHLDASLKFCRKGYAISSNDKLADSFVILLWLRHPRGSWKMNSTFENWFQKAFTSHFSLLPNQISEVTFNKQQYKANTFSVASFKLTLTPFQSLVMANTNEPNLNITRENIVFLQLLNFTGNYTLVRDGYNVSVINLISKQLSCYGEEKSHEDDIDRENGTFVRNKTGERLLLDCYYTIVKEVGGNVTLCRKLVLSKCTEGVYETIPPNDYVAFPNLSVYHKSMKRKFSFGEYLIRESSCKQKKDSTIAVCFSTKTSIYKNEIILPKILTKIGFSVSIICLAFLLITYGLFKELRTVPGLNLMNLSFSLMLSQLVWLVGISFFEGTEACKTLAVMEHYLLEASFVAMSVISHHTHLTLAKPLVGRIANKSWRRFIACSTLVWVTPAILVAFSLVLDQTNILPVKYGTNCWMGTANGKLYLFLLPLAILLFHNIYNLIQSARALFSRNKVGNTSRPKSGRKNLLICAKLATLVGVPWVSSFFGMLFPGEVAFEYVTILCCGLQGLYIAMAFLFNQKTLNLYNTRLKNVSVSNYNSRRQISQTRLPKPEG